MKNIKMMLLVFSKIILKNKNKNQTNPYISSTSIKLFFILRVFAKLESDSDNRNQGSTTNNFFTTVDQEFML